MSDLRAQLQNQFICAKCHARQANVREVVLSKSGIFDILPSKDTRYLEVTCQLCGYTEFYNRAIFAGSLARETEEVLKAARIKQNPNPNGQ